MVGNWCIAALAITYVPKKEQSLGALRRRNPSIGFFQFPSDVLFVVMATREAPFENNPIIPYYQRLFKDAKQQTTIHEKNRNRYLR
jgi:hypothetical protein